MRPKTLLILLLTSSLFLSCQKEPKVREEGQIIRWSVESVTNFPSRKSLVSHNDSLALYCTPSDEYYNGKQGKGKSIGFWADYIETQDGVQTASVNVFGAGQTRLIYKAKEGSPQMWNYDGKDLLWAIGGHYHIRSYFPQSMSSEVISSSTASCLVMTYNTHQFQEDLLLAYNRVYTQDPISGHPSIAIYKGVNGLPEMNEITTNLDNSAYGYGGEVFHLSDPIPLFFRHALSAIRIRFAYQYQEREEEEEEEEEEDELLSCYFTNEDNTNGLHTVGLLLYGDPLVTAPADDTREALERRWTEVNWESYQNSFKGTPFYRWGVASDGEGIPFSRKGRIIPSSDPNADSTFEFDKTMAIAYSSTDRQFKRHFVNGHLISEDELPGDRTLVMKKDYPPYFNENDGWLLILPQKSPESLYFHFETKKLGHKTIQMPTVTGTDAQGINDDPNSVQYFLPGYRYTYTLFIDETNFDLRITTSPWNEIYSSLDINL